MGAVEQVLQALKQAGFRAARAYPGGKFPHLTEAAAAVHLHRAQEGQVTVAVDVLCPGTLGGGVCEAKAAQIFAVLGRMGGSCIQSGCRYEENAQVYRVQILVKLLEAAAEGGPFTVTINGVVQPYAVSFTGEESTGKQAVHVMGEVLPEGLSQGKRLWNICLEEKIPLGSPETAEPEGEFEMKVSAGVKTELYSRCGWTSIRREVAGSGVRRIRKGVAMLRKEIANG